MTLEEIKEQAVKEFEVLLEPLETLLMERVPSTKPRFFKEWLRTTLDTVAEAAKLEADIKRDTTEGDSAYDLGKEAGKQAAVKEIEQRIPVLTNELMGKLFTIWSGVDGVSADEMAELIRRSLLNSPTEGECSVKDQRLCGNPDCKKHWVTPPLARECCQDGGWCGDFCKCICHKVEPNE